MSKKSKKAEEVSEGAPEWMTTYSDLVTLLLTFFILLFSMAVIDKQKFEEVAHSLRSSFSHISGGDSFNVNKGESMISLTPYDNAEELQEALEELVDEMATDDEEGKGEGEEANRAAQEKEAAEKQQAIKVAKVKIQDLIDELGLNENIKIIDEKDRVILRIDSLILFDSGSANLKESGRPVIEKIGLLLRNLETDIMVQGHADDRPIHTPLFPSNWELSTKRATNVIKYLIEKSAMHQRYLTATGNGEFKPIAPNDTEYNRQKNRRIDIVIAK